ncbi:MAG: VanZ family protein [Phycisphaerales bacterium]|nr:MAG: VanZ family protein [Phycisphaerales bacterium]
MAVVRGIPPVPSPAGSRTAVIGGAGYSTLAALVTVSVVYGELIPFRFTGGDGGSFWDVLCGLPWISSSLEDVITNMLVFVPVGALMTLHLARGLVSWRAAVVGGFLFAASLGACMETLQTFVPLRVASATDVLSNCVGGLTGALLASALYRRWRQVRPRLAVHLAICPHYLLFLGLAAVVAFAALAPFDFDFSVTRIRGAAASAQWWPLSGTRDLAIAAAGGDAQRVMLTWLRQAGVFAGLAFLSVRGLRELGYGPGVASLVTLRRTAAFVVGFECLQILTPSHVFELVDVLLGIAGAGMGMWLAFLVDGTRWHEVREFCHSPAPAVIALVCFAAYQAAVALQSAGWAATSESGDTITWLPFQAEFFLPMAAAVTALTLDFLTFAILTFLALVAIRSARVTTSAWTVVVIVPAWIGLLDAVRWWFGGPPPDTSGLALAIAGAMTAVLVLAWAQRVTLATRRHLAVAVLRSSRKAAHTVS